ncbi:MAG: ATP synthase F1 subunit gamma [Patescibacteria group bacterium]|jgi:F-type H+-transporting ATPase subunit gamma
MGVNTKTIKRRIKSISNTRKITKAMEMISAVKMRRAVQSVLSTRGYASFAWQMLTEIAQKSDVTLHPLLAKRNVKKVGVILITSNRGLAGGFSSRLLQIVHEFVSKQEKVDKCEVDILLTGRQGKKIYHKFGHKISAEFEKMDLTSQINEVLPMAQLAIKEYTEGKYDLIVVAYTDFASALRQIPRVKQILPLENKADEMLGQTTESNLEISASKLGYKFEPDPTAVLNTLLPRLVEMQIYQAVLESDASEHSARMLAMRNASDSAKDIIKELNYSFNKARQSAITQEISEIVGGAAALE